MVGMGAADLAVDPDLGLHPKYDDSEAMMSGIGYWTLRSRFFTMVPWSSLDLDCDTHDTRQRYSQYSRIPITDTRVPVYDLLTILRPTIPYIAHTPSKQLLGLDVLPDIIFAIPFFIYTTVRGEVDGFPSL